MRPAAGLWRRVALRGACKNLPWLRGQENGSRGGPGRRRWCRADQRRREGDLLLLPVCRRGRGPVAQAGGGGGARAALRRRRRLRRSASPGWRGRAVGGVGGLEAAGRDGLQPLGHLDGEVVRTAGDDGVGAVVAGRQGRVGAVGADEDQGGPLELRRRRRRLLSPCWNVVSRKSGLLVKKFSTFV